MSILRRHRALLFPALLLPLATGCQPVADDGAYIQDGAKPLPTPEPVQITDPLVLALISEPFTDGLLPEGAQIIERAPDPDRPEKVTFGFAGPHYSHRISYSVYADAMTATERFASIGETPSGRNVERSEPVELPDPERPTWGENSYEAYAVQGGERRAFVRTSLATVLDNVVCLSQVIVTGDQPAPDVELAKRLLAAGATHVQALKAATTAGD